jgi:putative aldouronate transport system substrate-binding protein
MKQTTKYLAMVLVLLLLAGVMIGCGSSNEKAEANSTAVSTSSTVASEAASTAPSSQKNVEISLAIWNVETAFAKNDKVLQDIQSKFNITLKPVNITWDDYSEKIQLWASSGSLPDVFSGNFRTTNSFNVWARQGLLHEIPENLSAYPTLQKYMNSPEKATCQVNGKTYCIFRQTFAEQSANSRQICIAYRWDLAQKAGITKEPTNWDEFRAMIQAIIKADPDKKKIKGVTALGYDRLTGTFLPYSNPLGCVNGTSFYWVDNGNGNYVPAYFAGDPMGSKTLPALQLLRDMYKEGTIESDIALENPTQARDKFLKGQVAALIGEGFGAAYQDVGDYWKDVHGTNFFDDVKPLDIMPDMNGQPAFPISDIAWSESYINAKVDDEKLDRILKLYDYLLTDEGAFKGTYGYEGETYKFDEKGTVQLLNGKPSDAYPSTDVFSILVRWNPNTYDKRFTGGSIAPAECTLADDRRQEKAKNFKVPDYDYSYTSTFTSLGSNFSLKVNEDILNIMTGTKPVKDMWQEIINGYKAQGLDDVIAKVNQNHKK